MSAMKRCDFSYLSPWDIVPLHWYSYGTVRCGTVKRTTVTPSCSSQCWCSTKPWLWGIAQIFLYNPPGTSASWSLIFDRAGFLQASWLVIYMAFFVVILIFPCSHCLLMSWFEVTSCSVQSLCTLLSDCWSGNWALLSGRSKVTNQHQILACMSKLWQMQMCWALIEEKAAPVPAGSSARSSIFHWCPMPSSVCRSICAAEISA